VEFNTVKQIRERNSEAHGDLARGVKAKVVLAPLDAADVRPMEAHPLGKLLL
jgi:hypothetical protein